MQLKSRCSPDVQAVVHILAVVLVLALGFPRVEAQLVINEILASNRITNVDEDGDSSDWVELLNTGDVALDLAGYALSDDADDPTRWAFPQAILDPGKHLLVWCSGKNRTRLPPERITEPNSPIPFEAGLVSTEAEWRYLVGMPEDEGPPADWFHADFDDAGWPVGKPGFGFGDDDDETVLPLGIGAVFLRHTFELPPERSLSNLVLQARYDDGFVVYINGVRVLSVNFPEDEEPSFASTANRNTEARRAERFDLSPWIDRLEPGENLLAMVLLNIRVSSNDLSLIPELGSLPPVFHTDFRLSGDGESVTLSSPGGNVRDRVDYPEQIGDQSYGRSPDGTGEFFYHLHPTPGEENSGPTSIDPLAVADTRFSVDRGFYDEPFDVEIFTETEGAVIRYTLDGSAPTEENGMVYTGPIPVSDTTTLRAAAFKPGLKPTDVDAQTYIFLETPDGGGVVNQPRNPPGFPLSWTVSAADYAMDPRIATATDSPFYDPRVQEGLLSLPTISIVMALGDLFDPRTGIYSNPQQEGVAWERPASVELIHPDGTTGFQVNAGLRMQGNASRNPNRPKHNMRLLFKTIYGPGKLRYPLFEDSAVSEFDTIILRGGNGDSWIHPNTTQQVRAQYIRDQWHRDTQLDMGHLTAHQIHAHLYINGLYWGLYHVFERPNASFLASYLGGDPEDYDAFNVDAIVDGDLRAWNTMVGIANAGLGTPEAYEEIQGYLDLPNLIDFLLVNFYSGNVDWDHRNWYAGRKREPSAQFRFFSWDSERTFWSANENRTTLNNAGRPTGVHQRLRLNPEYRLLFADHAHRHLFHGGSLTPEAVEARWMARADEIESPLSAEAARWGDNKRPRTPYTRDGEWRRELNSLRQTWFARRTALLLQQLQAQGLYPRIEAPSFNRHGGPVPAGFELRISAPAGVIHYTLDGSDPRLPGGDVSPGALVATDEGIPLEETTRARARVLDTRGWSALNEALFVVEGSFSLRLTEIMYHPEPAAQGSPFDAEEFEFLELKNVGDAVLDLSGVRLEGGLTFDFRTSPTSRLGPGQFVLLVENLEAFRSRYDTRAMTIAGEYEGRLSNGGEPVVVRGPLGETGLEVRYRDDWYPITDGGGHSLVLADGSVPTALSDKESWRPSSALGGSPGADDPASGGGLQLQGDANQDGRLNISDAIVLARLLLEDEGGLPLPCEGTSPGAGANAALLELNGDGTLDLLDVFALAGYLFQSGPPPPLGTECVNIPGCPDACLP